MQTYMPNVFEYLTYIRFRKIQDYFLGFLQRPSDYWTKWWI